MWRKLLIGVSVMIFMLLPIYGWYLANQETDPLGSFDVKNIAACEAILHEDPISGDGVAMTVFDVKAERASCLLRVLQLATDHVDSPYLEGAKDLELFGSIDFRMNGGSSLKVFLYKKYKNLVIFIEENNKGSYAGTNIDCLTIKLLLSEDFRVVR